MTERLRQPALQPPPIRPAEARTTDPSAFLEAHYQQIWTTRMHDLPFVNPALQVEAVGFVRHDGDWLGVVITPWFLNLLLLSGGGPLWGDIPAGERRYLNLPCGTLQFIADDDPEIGPYQYCPLIAPVSSIPDHATARQAALDAMRSVLSSLPLGVPETAGPPASTPVSPAEPAAPVSRRGFFRRLAGKQG